MYGSLLHVTQPLTQSDTVYYVVKQQLSMVGLSSTSSSITSDEQQQNAFFTIKYFISQFEVSPHSF